MILRPLFTKHINPSLYPLFKQTRNLRPTVKIGKDRFQVCIDVHQFNKDEIRVKALPEYVVVEGKQERKTKKGYIIRQFVKKFKLPDGCNPKTMKTELTPEGMLTITAPRKLYEANFPCETNIPISEIHNPQKNEETLIAVSDVKTEKKDPCEAYKVKCNSSDDKNKKP